MTTFPPTGAEQEIWKVFVGGLSWDTTEDQLREHFSRFGPLRNCLVMINPSTGKPRGFGFVECLARETMEAIVNTPGHMIAGRPVEVKRAVPKEHVYQKQEEQRHTKIFVGGLSWDATEESVKQVFEKYGPVVQVQIMRDHETMKPRGFAFVTFDSEQVVDVVCAKEHFEIDGKTCGVKRAEPRFNNPPRERERRGDYDDMRYGYGYGRGGPAYGRGAYAAYAPPPYPYPPAAYYAAPAAAYDPAAWHAAAAAAADPYAAYYAQQAAAVDPAAAAAAAAAYYAQPQALPVAMMPPPPAQAGVAVTTPAQVAAGGAAPAPAASFAAVAPQAAAYYAAVSQAAFAPPPTAGGVPPAAAGVDAAGRGRYHPYR